MQLENTMKIPTLLAAGVLMAALTPPAAASPPDPEPIPCAPDVCEPAPPCDAQAFVSLGQQVIAWRSRAEAAEERVSRLEVRMERRGDRIARLRARIARLEGWT